MKTEVLRQCIYRLYKVDWIYSHISKQQQLDQVVDYFEGLVDLPDDYSYEDYLEEFGYSCGDIYACYEEFIDYEYKDTVFIGNLLKDYPKLYEEYLADWKNLVE